MKQVLKPVAISFLRIAILGCMLTLFFAKNLSAQNIVVQGVVKDPSGAGIPAVSIKVRNAKSGASTDSLGQFSLNLKAASILDITAIGYNDTAIEVNGQNPLTIVLHSRQNNLQNVVVNTGVGNNVNAVVDPVFFDQIVASTLTTFTEVQTFSAGVRFYDIYDPSDRTPTHDVHVITTGFGPQNTINTGEILPSYTPKGETHGSRYLFNGYVGGVIIDSGNGLMQNAAAIYNYDKVDGSLLIRKDAQNNIEVDNAQVKGFALKNGDTSYVFMKVPALSSNQFYIFVGAGSKYAIFKSLKTKFVRSNYVSNGLTESGNNYDEFVDESQYYLVSYKAKAPTPVMLASLKKKALKQAFATDQQKLDAYFTQHRDDDMDEKFVKGLVEFIN